VRKTNESGAKIVLGKNVDADAIKAEAPDALIIAVGGKPIIPDIKGIDGPNVKDVSAVDRGDEEAGGNVVVCGAGLSGTECALALAMEGKTVTLVDMIPEEEFYNDIIHFTKPTITRLLEENNVKLMPECTVTEFAADAVIVNNAAGESITIPCDTAVIAFGVKADKSELAELCEVIPETYIIGDADRVGVIGDAIGAAFWMTREI
jgi:pyruvate/2-oxoglutarate dehydrogenase complex dihydrolipoamide dehydrogenase (E3) component